MACQLLASQVMLLPKARLLVLQLRKARDFQRLADQENDSQAGNTGGYRGPDGSGQWVSMGEMGAEDDLDMVLGGLGAGKAPGSIVACHWGIHVACHRAVMKHVAGQSCSMSLGQSRSVGSMPNAQ